MVNVGLQNFILNGYLDCIGLAKGGYVKNTFWWYNDLVIILSYWAVDKESSLPALNRGNNIGLTLIPEVDEIIINRILIIELECPAETRREAFRHEGSLVIMGTKEVPEYWTYARIYIVLMVPQV